MGTSYKIHPAIGIARLGTAPADPAAREGYYLAPEVENDLPRDPKTGNPVSGFRDAAGRLLKQAARFQVYVHDDVTGSSIPVVPGTAGVSAIEWTVYLANKKAAWYQFRQLTGSGMRGDAGYLENGPEMNPLRVNQEVADRRQLMLDPGPRTVGGDEGAAATFDLPAGPTTDPATCKPSTIRQLGSLFAEDDGSLLVFGGEGNSGTTHLRPADPGKQPVYEYATTHYANNEGWFDDTADGPVSATLILDSGQRVEVETSGWCIAAPPKYAPQVPNMVNLFDAIYDVAVREMGYRPDLHDGTGFVPSYEVDFEREIAPLLRRADLNHWVVDIKNGPAMARHEELANLGPDDGGIFPLVFVRSPAQVNDPTNPLILMPRLAGDNPLDLSHIPSRYLAMTQTQIFLLQQWQMKLVKGSSEEETAGVAIDHGVLRNGAGGAFCPGIEVTWICVDKRIYAEPFRIRTRQGVGQGDLDPLNGQDNLYTDGLEPGDLTKYMAQPWQADFMECSTQGDISGENPGSDWWWWPAQRPYDVFPQANPEQYEQWTRGFRPSEGDTFSEPNLGDMQMIVDWKHLGFVLGGEDSYLEVERQTAEIDGYEDPLIPDAED